MIVMQLVVIDRPEIKINLVDEVDNKVNDKADDYERIAAYLVSIITIVTIAYNSQIQKHYSM